MNRFIFSFSDSDFEGKGYEAPTTVYFFDLANADGIGFEEGTPEGDAVIDFATDMEDTGDYGVHDWCTTCNEKYDYYERVGYGSYEVPFDKWDELIQKWHDFFSAKGWEPGAIQSLTEKDYYAKFYPWAEYEE